MNKWDIQDWKVKSHTFKFRTGDTDEKGGCTLSAAHGQIKQQMNYLKAKEL